MDIRSLQKPLKDQYRNDPNSSIITIRAKLVLMASFSQFLGPLSRGEEVIVRLLGFLM